MQIVRIELFGFKSFMDRTILPLAGGITGVVGPNGCGKSNVVDATRWVLGETRARSLRGDLLEDVIFNGTDKLRPLGLAEVSMTLRSEEKDFFADLLSPELEAEILTEEVNEEAAASEESDVDKKIPETPQIENEDQTAADQVESVENSDEQSASPEETTETQSKAPTAVKGASATLLQKFSWLKSVNEVQITRRLYRSGESEFFLNRVPCRLKDLREFCRAIGMGPRAYTIVAQGEITRIVTAKPDERRAILEEAAGVQGFRDKIVAAQHRLTDTDLNIARLDDIIKEVTKQVMSLKRQAAKAQNRQRLKDELKRLDTIIYSDKLLEIDTELNSITSELDVAGQEELELSECLKERQTGEEEARSELMNIDVRGDELRAGIDEIKDELAVRDRARGERLAKIGELKALISGTENELQNLQERRVRLERRRADCAREIKELQMQRDALAEERRGIEELTGTDAVKYGEIIDNKKQSLRSKELQLRESRDEVVALKATLSSLQEQLESTTHVTTLENLLAEEKQGNELQAASWQVVAEGIKVPSHLTKAVQAALREKAAYFVVDDVHALMLKLKSLQSDEVLGISAVNKHPQPVEKHQTAPFKSLIGEIEVKEEFMPLVEFLLKDVYLVSSLEEAGTYFSTSGNADTLTSLVTPEGYLVTRDSFSELGNEAGIIQLRNKIDETQQRLSCCEEQHDLLEEECVSLRLEIESAEKEQLEAMAESKKAQEQILEISTKTGQVQGRLDGLYGTQNELQGDLDAADEQNMDAENRLDALQYRLDTAEEELTAAENEQDTSLEDELARRTSEYEGLERQRQEKRLRMNEIMRVVEDLKQQVDALRIKGAGLELRKQKLNISFDGIKDKVISEYGDELWEQLHSDQAAMPLEDSVRSEYEDEAARIRIRLVREGDVDPESITRLEEERTRLEQLEQQKSDLEKASRVLKKTIARLIETSIERFMATFEAVRNNFERLIPQLFNGGKGTLELTDPLNPLESGLDLTVRPPGKKLKSIELLSGGEKGLCAAALIFSMFLQRPSPLCILDEVDAPFDEVNLSRFISLIKEMSKQTQFIMITHNKQSMAVCDNLVGVTMQEPGASKILTVSLEDAYDQVA